VSDRVDSVPAMLLVVPQAAVESDPSADPGGCQRNSGDDLRGSQRTTSLHEPHTPAATAATAHAKDPTDDSGLHTATHLKCYR
jgi:hypothetical protein